MAPRQPAPAQVDVGAAMLADVENARQAIASRALLAAANDLNRGVDHADQLAGAASSVFPDDAPSPPSRHALGRRMSRFTAQVRLLCADTELANGDIAGADRDLATIETGVPTAVLPAAFPLVRAEESLDVAEGAAAANQTSELPAQLAIARAALQGYTGVAHRADAARLAAEIGQALAPADAADRILPDRLADWATRVGGWI